MIQPNLTTLTCDTSLSIHFRPQWISHNGKLLAAEPTPAGIPSGGMLMLTGRKHLSLLTTLTGTHNINLFWSNWEQQFMGIIEEWISKGFSPHAKSPMPG